MSCQCGEKNDDANLSDREKILSFGEMVEATERLTKSSSEPWKKACIIISAISAIAIISLSCLCGMLIYMAYMAPVDYGMEQGQDFNAQEQSQTYRYSESGD